MQKTRIIWHRFGKEHGEDTFQVNNFINTIQAGQFPPPERVTYRAQLT